jgi:hypothetical protein
MEGTNPPIRLPDTNVTSSSTSSPSAVIVTASGSTPAKKPYVPGSSSTGPQFFTDANTNSKELKAQSLEADDSKKKILYVRSVRVSVSVMCVP